MIPLFQHCFIKPPIAHLLLLMVSSLSVGGFASEQSSMARSTQVQVARYSTIQPAAEKGQLDLLAVTAPVGMPQDIITVGGALVWLLTDSGYQLATPNVLSEETKTMLQLPLPKVHRQFEPLPLKQVIELIIGPAFHVVQDPVHRLIVFDRCRDYRSQQLLPMTKGVY